MRVDGVAGRAEARARGRRRCDVMQELPVEAPEAGWRAEQAARARQAGEGGARGSSGAEGERGRMEGGAQRRPSAASAQQQNIVRISA